MTAPWRDGAESRRGSGGAPDLPGRAAKAQLRLRRRRLPWLGVPVPRQGSARAPVGPRADDPFRHAAGARRARDKPARQHGFPSISSCGDRAPPPTFYARSNGPSGTNVARFEMRDEGLRGNERRCPPQPPRRPARLLGVDPESFGQQCALRASNGNAIVREPEATAAGTVRACGSEPTTPREHGRTQRGRANAASAHRASE